MCTKKTLVNTSSLFVLEILSNATGREEALRVIAKKDINTRPLYFRKEQTKIDADLVKGQDPVVLGSQPIVNDSFAAGETFVLSGISIGANNNATNPLPLPSTLLYSKPTIPAHVNAELVFKVAKKEVLRIPVKAIIAAQEQDGNNGFYNLGGQIEIIEGGQVIAIELEAPDGTALPADNNFLEVGLLGVLLTDAK